MGLSRNTMRKYPRTDTVELVFTVPEGPGKLAITSSDYFVRNMGRNWKTLQRTTVAVAVVLTLLH